jgi:hypothetical protein
MSSPPSEKRTPLTNEVVTSEQPPEDFERGFRFWIIISGLAITTLLASLEHTVVTTAAPYILEDLDLKENYIWITNAFFVCRLVLFRSL